MGLLAGAGKPFYLVRRGLEATCPPMCRLFAFHSSVPSPAHHPLVVEANALREQSREHPHGWGIASYSTSGPLVVRGVAPAHEDEAFEQCSRSLSSRTVVAHVRKASVGAPSIANTHPFQHGPWVMAHNGTVPEFDTVRASLEALIAPAHREKLQGETDSERIFALLLTALERRSASDRVTVDVALQALEETVRAVLNVCAPLPKRPSLNVVFTNGKLLVAFRHGRSLFCSTRKRLDGADAPAGVLACIPGSLVAHLVVSSERIGPEDDWHELPEDEFVAIDERMDLVRGGLSIPLSDSGELNRQVA